MSILLILILVLIFLVIIDFYRKSLRHKQKQDINTLENGNDLILQAANGNKFAHLQEVKKEYPLLQDGYLLLHFEAIENIEVKQLAMFLKYYGIRFTDEKIFQKINSKDVIFSILPDNDSQMFESSDSGEVKRVIAVMNFRKLSAMGYDAKTCYELMMDILEAMNKSFNGTLMNEHKIRITKIDKQNYMEAIIS